MPRSPESPPPDAPGLLPRQPLAWGRRVSPAFRHGVYTLCARLGWTEDHASWLMAAIAFETGRTFSASVRNPRSSAVGLIQFMRATAANLGTSTDALARMSRGGAAHLRRALLPPLRQPHRQPGRPLPGHPVARGHRQAPRLGAVAPGTKAEAAAKVQAHLAQGLLADNAWRPPEIARPAGRPSFSGSSPLGF